MIPRIRCRRFEALRRSGFALFNRILTYPIRMCTLDEHDFTYVARCIHDLRSSACKLAIPQSPYSPISTGVSKVFEKVSEAAVFRNFPTIAVLNRRSAVGYKAPISSDSHIPRLTTPVISSYYLLHLHRFNQPLSRERAFPYVLLHMSLGITPPKP